MGANPGLGALLAIALVAAAAPIVVGLVPRLHLPQVVVFLIGGALGLVGILAATGFVHAFVPVSLALTTTALGLLLPILRYVLGRQHCALTPVSLTWENVDSGQRLSESKVIGGGSLLSAWALARCLPWPQQRSPWPANPLPVSGGEGTGGRNPQAVKARLAARRSRIQSSNSPSR